LKRKENKKHMGKSGRKSNKDESKQDNDVRIDFTGD
jgi:hypothetical protein